MKNRILKLVMKITEINSMSSFYKLMRARFFDVQICILIFERLTPTLSGGQFLTAFFGCHAYED